MKLYNLCYYKLSTHDLKIYREMFTQYSPNKLSKNYIIHMENIIQFKNLSYYHLTKHDIINYYEIMLYIGLYTYLMYSNII